MGIGGHKHHYNEAHIEKEMKAIGDAVGRRQNGSQGRPRLIFALLDILGSFDKTERIMQSGSCLRNVQAPLARVHGASQW